jgi:uncharacterized protein
MQLADASVLVHAFRTAAPRHAEYRAWLEELINGDRRYATSELVLSSVVRILTNSAVLDDPEEVETAFAYAEFLRTQPLCVVVAPGPRHWEIFRLLCRDGAIQGGRTSDAYLAALAIEHGCEFVTADRHFARFPGLRCRHPLES